MVNRGDTVEQQMEWKVPISIMFNLTHLQQSHAVITVSDYLRLHNISTEVESTGGHWDVDACHSHNAVGVMTHDLYVTENLYYDPYSVIRVDYIPQDSVCAEGGVGKVVILFVTIQDRGPTRLRIRISTVR